MYNVIDELNYVRYSQEKSNNLSIHVYTNAFQKGLSNVLTCYYIKFRVVINDNLLELTLEKDVLFIIWDWNAKVRNQETPELTGKFVLGIRNEAE